MYTEASLDPERCIHNTDQHARNQMVANQLRQLGHYEDVSNPNNHTQEEYMEEDINMGEIGQDPQAPMTKPPLGGCGAPVT
jgi:hypothetical protein